MQKLQNSIKSNSIHLRICIQCEMMEKEPIWNSYKRFCEKLGEDAMDFPEFEFWYWRFYNGETDVEYDRSTEPKKLTFQNLSKQLLSRIVEELNPFERILFRQVSPGTQSIVDGLDPKFQSIDIIMHADPTPSRIKFGNFEDIKYYPMDHGYKMEYGGVDQILDSGDHLDEMVFALESFFNSGSRNLEELFVVIGAKTVEDWKKLMGKLPILNVKSVDFIGKDTKETPSIFLNFLSLLKPGYLESIDLFLSPDTDISFFELAKTEQWKQAKRAKIRKDTSFKSDQLQYFYHFEEVEVKIEDLTMEELVELRDNLRESPNFKTCIIESKLNFTAEDFAMKIGETAVGKEYVLDSIEGMGDFLEFCGGFDGKFDKLRIERRRGDFLDQLSFFL